MKQQMENCALCNESSILQNSHIIPNFFYKHIKEAGNNYIFETKNHKKRLQDGKKVKLLCQKCEEKFSLTERYFSELIFKKIKNNTLPDNFKYNEKLYFFISSIIWRNLITYDTNCFKDNELSFINKKKNQIKQFLNDGIIDENINFYMSIIYECNLEVMFPNYNNVNSILKSSTAFEIDYCLLNNKKIFYYFCLVCGVIFFGTLDDNNFNKSNKIKISNYSKRYNTSGYEMPKFVKDELESIVKKLNEIQSLEKDNKKLIDRVTKTLKL